MLPSQPTKRFDLARAAQKFAVSAFVICSFAAYALHERLVSPDDSARSLAVASNPSASRQAPPATGQEVPATASPQLTSKASPILRPSSTKTPSTVAAGQYKDGSYTGNSVDAFYGYVQVQAVIRNGKIADVQFIQYPNDRRTSARINSVAVPRLKQEAIQAQSARVNIITGATLTSEAFMQSLQAALGAAKA